MKKILFLFLVALLPQWVFAKGPYAKKFTVKEKSIVMPRDNGSKLHFSRMPSKLRGYIESEEDKAANILPIKGESLQRSIGNEYMLFEGLDGKTYALEFEKYFSKVLYSSPSTAVIGAKILKKKKWSDNYQGLVVLTKNPFSHHKKRGKGGRESYQVTIEKDALKVIADHDISGKITTHYKPEKKEGEFVTQRIRTDTRQQVTVMAYDNAIKEETFGESKVFLQPLEAKA